MKRIASISVLGIALLCGSNVRLAAQSNAIKINILSPILRTANISYERVLNESSSAQLGFLYTGAQVSGVKFSGFAITPEYRFYLSQSPAPDGFYVAPFLRYQNYDLKEEDTNSVGDLQSFGGGLVIGRQWLFKEKVTLDLFFGPQYLSGQAEATSGDTGELEVGGTSGFWFRFGLTLGIAF